MSVHLMNPNLIVQFVDSVRGLGGTFEAELQHVVDGYRLINTWQPPNLLGDLGKAVKAGTLTAAALDAAAVQVDQARAAEVRGVAMGALNRRFAELLAGSAGDSLIESLRPRFDEALAQVEAAAALFPPDATAADVLELGTTATDAWRELPQARQVLDSIYSGVVCWLTTTTKGPEVLAGRPRLTDDASHSDVLRVSFLVKAPGRPIAELAHALEPHGAGTARAGRWHRLIATLGIGNVRLNTISEARAVLDYYQRQNDEAAQAKRDRDQALTDDYRRSVSR